MNQAFITLFERGPKYIMTSGFAKNKLMPRARTVFAICLDSTWHNDNQPIVVMEVCRNFWKLWEVSCIIQDSEACCPQSWVWQIQSSLLLDWKKYCFPEDFRWWDMLIMVRVLIHFLKHISEKISFLRSWDKLKTLAIVPILWFILCNWSFSSAYWDFLFLLFFPVIHSLLKPTWLSVPPEQVLIKQLVNSACTVFGACLLAPTTVMILFIFLIEE